MRIIFGLFLILILTGCGTTTDYYTPTVNSWRGGNVKTLVKTWGMPDDKVTGPGGNTVLVYNLQRFRTMTGSTSPSTGVTFTPGGTPIITTIPNTSMAATRGMALSCTTMFIANAEGTILQTKSQGPCTGSSSFQAKMANPTTGKTS
jgi:hypothetical protein